MWDRMHSRWMWARSHSIPHPSSPPVSQDMEAECFGGEENGQHSQHQYSTIGSGPSASSSSTAWRRERNRNAFMLVYDRVLPQQQGEPAAANKGNSGRTPSSARFPSSPPPSSPVAPSASSPPPPPPPPPLSATTAAFDGGDNEDGEASPRAGGGEPVRAPRDNNQNASAHWKQGVGESRGQRRRKRFRAKVPAVFMRQIHQENLEFWRFVAALLPLSIGQACICVR